MKHEWTWLGALAYLAVSWPATAESQSRLRFDHLAVEDGLSHNHVYAVLKDSRGFVWLGTADGANRYDGNGFVAYHHDPEDSGSLPSATVEAFFEDSRKRLWVGTSSGDAGLSQPARTRCETSWRTGTAACGSRQEMAWRASIRGRGLSNVIR